MAGNPRRDEDDGVRGSYKTTGRKETSRKSPVEKTEPEDVILRRVIPSPVIHGTRRRRWCLRII
ncbi:hypothetical protein V1478_011866 [Vespula squamosa]|uniref:Uncharacterized protein n=1 Tax=Vespula squamosa TaxID=30214 RepID=A0ABD2ABR6_VESSQ